MTDEEALLRQKRANKAAPASLTWNAPVTHEIEEEIADVSLATFYVFDNEAALRLWRGRRLPSGGCGYGCG
jgi:hypothetical protein